MKKFLILILLFAVFTFALPSASAQTRHRRRRHSRTFWQKHRDKLTVAGTTAAGAGIGGLAGGKKGALIGTAAPEAAPSTLTKSASVIVIAGAISFLTSTSAQAESPSDAHCNPFNEK